MLAPKGRTGWGRRSSLRVQKQVELHSFPEFGSSDFLSYEKLPGKVTDLFQDERYKIYVLTPGSSVYPDTSTRVTIDFAVRIWPDDSLVDCDKNVSFMLDFGGTDLPNFFHPIVSCMQEKSEIIVRVEEVRPPDEDTGLSTTAVLLVYIKLVQVHPYQITEEEKRHLQGFSLDERDKKLLEAKAKGTQFFKSKSYKLALDCFTKATRLLSLTEQPKSLTSTRLEPLLYSKCAFASFHLGRFKEAHKAIESALKYEPYNYKFLVVRALLWHKLLNPSKAVKDLQAVAKITTEKKTKYMNLVLELTEALKPHFEKPSPLKIKEEEQPKPKLIDMIDLTGPSLDTALREEVIGKDIELPVLNTPHLPEPASVSLVGKRVKIWYQSEEVYYEALILAHLGGESYTAQWQVADLPEEDIDLKPTDNTTDKSNEDRWWIIESPKRKKHLTDEAKDEDFSPHKHKTKKRRQLENRQTPTRKAKNKDIKFEEVTLKETPPDETPVKSEKAAEEILSKTREGTTPDICDDSQGEHLVEVEY